MTIYDLKSKFQGLLRPLTSILAKAGITANQVTIFALLASVIMGGLLLQFRDRSWALLILPGFLFFRMALNAIDGMLAREHDQKSDLGALLNEMGDVLSDIAIYIPFAFFDHKNFYLVMAIVLATLVSEFAGVLAFSIKVSRRYDGPMGKSDRAFWFSIIAILLAFKWIDQNILQFIYCFMFLLLVVTTINRCKNALKEDKL